MIIVDTSVWVDFLNGTENLQTERLSESLKSETPVFYTGLILQEVLQGLRLKKQRILIRKEFQKLLLITPSVEDHIRGAEIFTMCRSKGLTIRKSIDCLIAALCLNYSLSLLDRDKDFSYVAKCFPLSRLL